MPVEHTIVLAFHAFALFTFGSGSTELDAVGIGFLCGTETIRPLPEALEIDQLTQD